MFPPDLTVEDSGDVRDRDHHQRHCQASTSTPQSPAEDLQETPTVSLSSKEAVKKRWLRGDFDNLTSADLPRRGDTPVFTKLSMEEWGEILDHQHERERQICA